MDTRQVADRVHSAAIHVLRRAGEADRDGGITPARLSALSVVIYRGPLSLGALAEAEGVRSATMTGIVNGLEDDGLVRRRAHASDRRAVLVEATARGRRALEAARTRRLGLIAERLGDLSAAELAAVARAAELLEARFAPHRAED